MRSALRFGVPRAAVAIRGGVDFLLHCSFYPNRHGLKQASAAGAGKMTGLGPRRTGKRMGFFG